MKENMVDLEVTAALIGISVIIATIYWWYGKRRYRLPPGPIGLPLVGYLPFLDVEGFRTFKQLSEKYGNIFSLYLGSSFVVVLNENKLVKEAFGQSILLDRPPHMFSFHPGDFGFASSNGDEWVEQRRFTMKSVKDIGFGRSQWENLLMMEVEEFKDWIKTYEGKPVNIYSFLSASVSNNMTSLVFGKRLPAGDPARDIVDDEIEAFRRTFRQSGFVAYFPKLLSFIAKIGISRLGEERKIMVRFDNFLKREMEARKEMMANERNEDIFVDGYLKEIEKRKQKATKNSFSEKNLLGNSKSLIIGGSETTRASIFWLFLAMVTYPEVQKKVQEEIDIVLGKDVKIAWMERAKLSYVHATIMECQRWRTVAPLNILRRASADTVISGYDIPKGSTIIANIWAIHNDPEYWKDPEKFIPERFISEEDGKLTTHKPDNYIPFSFGRRNCPGELLAMIEILHYFVVIMQNFRILPEIDGKLPDLSGELGITYQAKPQKLRFIPRE